MRIMLRSLAIVLGAAALWLWLAGAAVPQGHTRPSTFCLDWEERSGQVTYSDGAGCSCSSAIGGKCSVQYDRHGRNIGSCDNNDNTCGDITGCPH